VPLTPSERAALERAAEEWGVVLGSESIARLGRYVDELRLWLPRVSLVSRGDAEDIVERHLVDSLAAAPLLAGTSEDALIGDIGSGAGLPGIPLAVALSPRRLILVEPRRKRASFLRAAARVAAPLAVEIRESRVEDLADGDLVDRLAATVTRAALTSDFYLASVRPLLRCGGQALAFRSEADASREAGSPGFTEPEVHRYAIAGGRRRFALVRWRREDGALRG